MIESMHLLKELRKNIYRGYEGYTGTPDATVVAGGQQQVYYVPELEVVRYPEGAVGVAVLSWRSVFRTGQWGYFEVEVCFHQHHNSICQSNVKLV